jgi:hypothetical protein
MFWIRFFKRQLGAAFALLGIFSTAGCSAPVEVGSDPIGKQAILDWVDIALSDGNCADAVAKVKPLYDSANVDNNVRMKTASAYACYAEINFFKTVSDIGSNSSAMVANAGAGFWPCLA